MVSLNHVERVILQGNTYPNLDRVRRTGAKYDNGSKCWMLPIAGHPLNNVKQRKKLEAMLNELQENGVEIVIFYSDGKCNK